MAHIISEVSGRSECFTAGEKPWHGLGVNVPDRVTSKEAIELAGLNWKVEQGSLYFTEKDIPLVNAIPSSFNSVTDRVVNYRTDKDGKPVYLGTVSPNYKLIQNIEAFNFFDEVIGENLAVYETAGAIRNGQRIWILAKLPENLIINAEGGKDAVEKYLLFANGHDGYFGCRMFFTPVRVVCNNTLSLATGSDKQSGMFIRHRGDVKNKVEEAVRILKIANEHYQNIGLMFQKMAQVKYRTDDAKKYFETIVPDAPEKEGRAQKNIELTREYMIENFKRGAGHELSKDSLWGAYNAVTQYADHQRFDIRKPRAEHSRFESVIWGNSAILKTKAYKEAVEIAQSVA